MRILFVCTGNTCRSPMAEGLLRKIARERGLDVEVRSAGVAAAKGAAMSMHAEAVLKDRGIADKFESTPLHGELAEWADLILTLTQGHKRQAVYTFPHTADKIYTLKEFVEDDGAVLAEREELQRLIADRELGKALGRKWTDAEERRLNELQQRMPVYDISDPYGGSRADYDRTAAEIGAALEKLADKLQRGELGK
ncbi:low molecular weight protein arginine phosphatase [Paenibacillus macerans]|uniref:low molecular weight protein arginine phosphatase n=1 Tax=Paenibacillus macerans TaxID=44252 RepID=UPI00203D0B81|nr:low molecular weight protein arginine phosphatase [Paenibacillus macerans]MCM3700967.1 low molecular weight protein arginine phosphatase [Paenibacillus macerans]